MIYRERARRAPPTPRSPSQLTLTRAWPPDWDGRRGRIDDALLAELAFAPAERPLVYVCGPNGFVEQAAGGLVRLGHDPLRIHTERFGPSG